MRSWALWSWACCTAAPLFPPCCTPCHAQDAQLGRRAGRRHCTAISVAACAARAAHQAARAFSRLQRARGCGSLRLLYCSRMFTWEPGT